MTSKDPNSYIQASAETLAETLLSKNHDYAPEGEFSNFEQAAKLAAVSPLEAILVQIGIKVTRIDTLTGSYQTPENEPLKDSFLDLAGYALIAHAYLSAMEPDRILIEPSDRPVDIIEPDDVHLHRYTEGPNREHCKCGAAHPAIGPKAPHWLVRDDI